MKQKHVKGSEEDKAQSEVVSEDREGEASVVANGGTRFITFGRTSNHAVILVPKRSPIWKARKCTTWDDESKIAMIGTEVSE